MTVMAPLGQQASRWRQRLTGPVLLADRGSEDAAVARRAAADIAARTGIPLRIVTAWAVPAVARVTPTSSNLNVPGVYEDSAHAAQQEIRARLAPAQSWAQGTLPKGMRRRSWRRPQTSSTPPWSSSAAEPDAGWAAT